MHIILVGPEYYNYSEGIISAFISLGCEVDFFPSVEFYENCSWYQRRLYKLGYKSLEKIWNNDWETRFREFIANRIRKDTIFLFCTGNMISVRLLKDLDAYVKVLYMWDSVKRYSDDFQSRLKLYDYLFAFEFGDIEFVRKKYGVSMQYMPLGYDSDFYYPDDNVVKDIDISFVGSCTKMRMNLLEKVARFADCKELHLYIGGDWYKDSWRKKRSFKKKNPWIAKYHDNHNLSKAEVAEIYRRSKIVLNINNEVHTSISPRTFEIMATKAFQLMNEGQNFLPLGLNRIDDCMGVYISDDDLITKIEYYLNNEEICKKKAMSGYREIVDRYSQKKIVGRILSNVVG